MAYEELTGFNGIPGQPLNSPSRGMTATEYVNHIAPDYEARIKQARRVISLEESEQTEKTLHHLSGRVEELRARLERILIPAEACGNPALVADGLGQKNGAASPLSDRLRSFRKLAQGSIDTVEDILNRLDV